MSISGRTQMVILGGGFGGIYTAMHLEKRFAHMAEYEHYMNFILHINGLGEFHVIGMMLTTLFILATNCYKLSDRGL